MITKPLPYFNILVLTIFGLFFITPSVLAQKNTTLSGYIQDAGSGEKLIGASLYFPDLQKGTITNSYGFFSITLPAGEHKMILRFIGYENIEEVVNLKESLDKTYRLKKSGVSLAEVVITERRADENISSTDVGVVNISMATVKKLPILFGEADVLKAIQLMPGIQSAGEGNSGFYVRGGGPDQNLVLLDEAVVYNTGHLFGFFSIFNSDAIKDVSLIKGGMPAQYGGRLSSVLDVTMKEGNNQEFHGEGGVGLIASRLTLEGPIVNDKGSFIVSGRRTYVDVVMKPFLNKKARNNGYYFYDMNLKANYKITKKDHLYLSSYFGRDAFKFKGESGNFNIRMPWGNFTSTLRWNRQWSPKLFMNVAAIYNEYDFTFEGGQEDLNIQLYSGIKDWNGKVDFDYFVHPNHLVKFGMNYTYHTFIPNQVSGKAISDFTPEQGNKKFAHETSFYIADEFAIGDQLKINAGLRYAFFSQVGPYTAYDFDENLNATDSISYGSGEVAKTYDGWEPRLNARWQFDDYSSIKGSFTLTNQFIHLVTNNGSTFPTDIWMPSTAHIKPQKSLQYSLGYFRNFLDNDIETSVEVYYKDLQNQLEFRPGYTPTTFRDPEHDVVFGSGRAYGAEFFVRKNAGKLTGWIGYTLSWTDRLFPELNEGNRFPAKYDRRHDLSIVLSYPITPKWELSGVFVYASGNAITLPTGFYIIDNQLVQDFSKINEYRIFPYHRLDLSMNYTPKSKKDRRWQSSWNFSVYNVYSRQNPYILFVDTEGSPATGLDVKVKQISIFPILPSVTYNFKF